MPTLTTLVTFPSVQGGRLTPSGLLIDDAGDLYGTTTLGGVDDSSGTVFEVAHTSSGYATGLTTLASFDGSDGANPYSGVIADVAGDLFGTTFQGGATGYGTVFELANTPSGYANSPTTLVSFNGSDGEHPETGLVADAAGDLFGTTEPSGANGDATVFEIAKGPGGYASTPTTLASFSLTGSGASLSALTVDAAGNLFGTTEGSDSSVFEIPYSNGSYAGTPTTLVTFNGSNGTDPHAGLIADSNGDLFGTTVAGGSIGNGTVFELVNNDSGSYSFNTLANFNYADGSGLLGGVIADAAGNLFGTTASGGANGDGTVFEIVNTPSGYDSTPITLASFDGSDGDSPYVGLVADAAGNLFGTTAGATTGDPQTVFEVSDTGFVVACYVLGTQIAGSRGQVAVEDLREGDLVVTATGEAKPIRWIGRSDVDCRRHPQPELVWPVCIVAGAFGEGLPARDLFLSPDHAVHAAGVLIPVKYLVNGATVTQVRREHVTYFHVELAHHDILLAEGLPAESYLDTGNRDQFANGGSAVALHADFSRKNWDHACAPLCTKGHRLQALRRRLLARINGLGYRRADASSFCLVTGERVLRPAAIAGQLHQF